MFVRIYTGDDGQSHLQAMDPLTEPTHRIATKPGEDLVFRTFEAGRAVEWHNPGRRQYLFMLAGQMEVSVQNGTTMIFSPGDVLLAEDMTGQGHLTRTVGSSYTSVSMGIPD